MTSAPAKASENPQNRLRVPLLGTSKTFFLSLSCHNPTLPLKAPRCHFSGAIPDPTYLFLLSSPTSVYVARNQPCLVLRSVYVLVFLPGCQSGRTVSVASFGTQRRDLPSFLVSQHCLSETASQEQVPAHPLRLRPGPFWVCGHPTAVKALGRKVSK